MLLVDKCKRITAANHLDPPLLPSLVTFVDCLRGPARRNARPMKLLEETRR
jgi:hypothetical protein